LRVSTQRQEKYQDDAALEHSGELALITRKLAAGRARLQLVKPGEAELTDQTGTRRRELQIAGFGPQRRILDRKVCSQQLSANP
jgi:hypothetical protein